MGAINWGRVVLGGLVAGLVINVGEFVLNEMVLAEQWTDAFAAMGIEPATGGLRMLVWVLWGFALGFVAVWMYAAIRPRYGAGAKTAAIAGGVTWFLGCFLWGVSMLNLGLLPSGMMLIAGIWGVVEFLVATTVGAWLYQEAV